MKKRIGALLTATVLFLSIFAFTATGEHVFAATQAKVTASSLNVREKPITSSKSLGMLAKGKVVTISATQGSWSKIPYGKSYGWVLSKYVSKITVTAVKNGYVTASSLNLRKTASTKSGSLGLLTKGTLVNIKSQSGSWMNIYVPSNKKTGWVSKSYISDKKPSVTSATKATVSGTKYYVTADSLNVRKSAAASSAKITAVTKGSAVTLYEKKGTWGRIKTASNKTGWVSIHYLTAKKPAKAPAKAEVPSKGSPPDTGTDTASGIKYYVTGASSLNIRDSAGTSGKILTAVNKGLTVTLFETKGTWGKVITSSGITGWASLAYLSKNPPAKGVQGKVIVIDAGHGGKDPGTSGKNNLEKTVTLNSALKLQSILTAAGAKVIMTRSGDTYPTLSDRVNISHKYQADVFISIHFNANPNKSTNGIDTYYWTKNVNERELAECIQEEVIKQTGLSNRGVHTGNFQVIRENKNPAVLIELGFLSNPAEEKTVSSAAYQLKAATGIYNGLEKYFASK
ncbi:N-acetylmuramoyl-L-alanine amidase [Actinomycetes bacterium NPDC127524]